MLVLSLRESITSVTINMPQLTLANKQIHDLRLYKLQQLRRLPTYNVQGMLALYHCKKYQQLIKPKLGFLSCMQFSFISTDLPDLSTPPALCH